MAQTHPFINGDKRTAFVVTYTFLAANCVRISADADETMASSSCCMRAQPSSSHGFADGCKPT